MQQHKLATNIRLNAFREMREDLNGLAEVAHRCYRKL